MLTWKVVKDSADTQHLALTGALNEHVGASLDKLKQTLKARQVVLDCAGIDSINSTGSRVWAQFLVEMKRTHQFELVKCSSFLIDYLNMVPKIAYGCRVSDFQAPMRCPACGNNQNVLLKSATVRATGNYGNHACEKCGKGLTPVVGAADYFEFLESDEILV